MSSLATSFVFRYLAYNSYTESVLCTGMTNMEHIVYPQRYTCHCTAQLLFVSSDTGDHLWFIMLGHIKHEGFNDRRLQQSCKQFISSGWWLKVTFPLPPSIVPMLLHSYAIQSGVSSTYLCLLWNAAYHSLSMIYPNQWSRLTSLILSRLHWFERTLALYSCCRCLNSCLLWMPTLAWNAGTQNDDWADYAVWDSQVITCPMNELHGFLVSTFAAFQIGFVLKSSSWSQVFVACLDSPSVDL
jgi:hypothetical protein